VPDLQKTLIKYEDILQPIVSISQLKKVKEIVREFGKKGGQGEQLQELLLLNAETKENWVMMATSSSYVLAFLVFMNNYYHRKENIYIRKKGKLI
jgi:hypothetical protein